MKRYIDLVETNYANALKIELSYNLGGYNVFTYKKEDRGYYLSISPVLRENKNGYTMESYTAFTGVKQLIHTITRKSEKAEKIAIEKAKLQEKTLIQYVLQKNGLSLLNPEEL